MPKSDSDRVYHTPEQIRQLDTHIANRDVNALWEAVAPWFDKLKERKIVAARKKEDFTAPDEEVIANMCDHYLDDALERVRKGEITGWRHFQTKIYEGIKQGLENSAYTSRGHLHPLRAAPPARWLTNDPDPLRGEELRAAVSTSVEEVKAGVHQEIIHAKARDPRLSSKKLSEIFGKGTDSSAIRMPAQHYLEGEPSDSLSARAFEFFAERGDRATAARAITKYEAYEREKSGWRKTLAEQRKYEIAIEALEAKQKEIVTSGKELVRQLKQLPWYADTAGQQGQAVSKTALYNAIEKNSLQAEPKQKIRLFVQTLADALHNHYDGDMASKKPEYTTMGMEFPTLSYALTKIVPFISEQAENWRKDEKQAFDTIVDKLRKIQELSRITDDRYQVVATKKVGREL